MDGIIAFVTFISCLKQYKCVILNFTHECAENGINFSLPVYRLRPNFDPKIRGIPTHSLSDEHMTLSLASASSSLVSHSDAGLTDNIYYYLEPWEYLACCHLGLISIFPICRQSVLFVLLDQFWVYVFLFVGTR